MKNVVIMASKDIGHHCFKYALNQQKSLGFKVIGLLSNKRGQELIDLANDENITLLTLEEYEKLLNVDICISIQYHKILNSKQLSVAREYSINLHMAPIPEYRGCNQFSYAIMNEEKEFGTSLHFMTPKIDGGGLIAERRFEIPPDIWVEELLIKTVNESKILFEENFASIISGNVVEINQYQLGRRESFHSRDSINDLKEINLNDSQKNIEKRIRATAMSGFPPPYFYIGEKKIEISIET